ncbi:uncharacterized protein DSM5745_09153 [Aspergillus mulundensis]|uniref:DUF6594 domain-containing protein n=1 Tax=Aspergillus mulundensis TaxID=1810919 RepID=A0A3D8QZU2_9EURO|nr:hypothetical protein DSM5745_09153 [Aspergillus mulundensis]RDW67287.1 hypothetical protein DSM5745_09153 [Aspergillus mulundensis]
MAAASDAAIFREFGWLQMQKLLYLQAELHHLESGLRATQDQNAASNSGARSAFAIDYSAMREDEEHGQVQVAMMQEICTKVTEYNTALLQVMELRRAPRPTDEEAERLRRYMEEREGVAFPFGLERSIWSIANQNDFLILPFRERRGDLVTRFVRERVVNMYDYLVGRRNEPPNSPGYRIYRDETLEYISRAIVAGVSAMMPPLAIAFLWIIKPMWARVLFIFVFTGIFAMITSAVTMGKSSDIFAATTAFTAVEVVFVGSTSS